MQAMAHVPKSVETSSMGFYLRKSLKAGPFRFNLSKSGVGVSAGVRGFRVGSGPRGNYVHMGRNGVYYRSSPGGPSSRRPALVQQDISSRPTSSAHLDVDPVLMEDITGATTAELAASTSSELLEQIRGAAGHHRAWPWILVATLVLVSALNAVPALSFVILAIGVAASWWVRQWDVAKSSVVVFYDVNDEHAARFQPLVSAFDAKRLPKRAWELLAQGQVRTTYQRKVNAGASSLVSRDPGTLSVGGPPVLVTNIAVPSIQTKRRAIYLLPDRVLVRSGRSYAEVQWGAISSAVTMQRFIESEGVPSDSQVVGQTWKYVNKNGGPDKRFKDNRQLPVVLYGELELRAPSGFHAVWQLSRRQAAEDFAAAIVGMRGR
jgi:DNA polymerase-3 subunit epsilon